MCKITVVGGGLAGCEAAWRLASEGFSVDLYEKRPLVSSPAHKTDLLAELVCSNSLGADGSTSPAGILKQELRRLGSLILACADATAVPAGKALAVDRRGFSALVTERISGHPNINLIRREYEELSEGPCILAVGPLMSGAASRIVSSLVGDELLSFFDAAAPIVTLESVDESLSFRAGRWGVGDDYVNCPLNREEYEAFVQALLAAELAPLHEEDAGARYFEGCLPVEVMASRGPDTLRYGPMRPVGLIDPRDGLRPYAVLQLRRDNAEGTLYNLVGFQTNLKWGEQERVFRMIPALAHAEFVRLGVMHRNAFVCAPRALDPFHRPRPDSRPSLFLAGQITGVEGYMESSASGLLAAFFMSQVMRNEELTPFPRETALGSLLHYLATAAPETFQPMNVNLGIFPPLGDGRKKVPKRERAQAFAERSERELIHFLSKMNS